MIGFTRNSHQFKVCQPRAQETSQTQLRIQKPSADGELKSSLHSHSTSVKSLTIAGLSNPCFPAVCASVSAWLRRVPSFLMFLFITHS